MKTNKVKKGNELTLYNDAGKACITRVSTTNDDLISKEYITFAMDALVTKLAEDLAYATPQMVEAFKKHEQLTKELEQVTDGIARMNTDITKLVAIARKTVSEQNIVDSRTHEIYKKALRDIIFNNAEFTIETVVALIEKHKKDYEDSQRITRTS